MPTLNSEIKDIVAGDDLDVLRTIENVPAGQTLAKAWFTVRLRTSSSVFIFQKTITVSSVPGQGHITDAGSSGTASVRFELQPADTILLALRQVYVFDIQVKTSTDKLYTPELGKIRAEVQRTITET